MPIVYDFYINGEKVNAEIGFTIQESGEEKLNSGSLKIVNTRRATPYPMLSLVEVDKKVIDDYDKRNILDREITHKLLISDTVEQAGSYGYYNHSLNIIEYTHKLDYYLQASLVESFGVIDNRSAPFITKSKNKELSNHSQKATYSNEEIMPPIKVNSVYRGRFKLKATGLATIAVETNNIGTDTISCKAENVRTFIRFSFDNKVIDVTDKDVDIEVQPGEWAMDYGYTYNGANHTVFTYQVKFLENKEITVYDLVMNVRNNVSKYGGIESKHYFNDTRLFDVDLETEKFLKSVVAPQVFLENATARQMLIFVLQYVNALPKLVKEGGVDVLHLIRYNEYEGKFSINDVSGYNAEHDTNQIGSRSYSPLKQVLPNSFDEPTLYTPMKDGFKTVRATSIQLTSTDYELKLEKPIYKPLKFEAVVPIIYKYRPLDSNRLIEVEEDVVLDLTDQLIHKNEWDLKDIKKEFPSVTPNRIYSKEIGLLPYKYDSFYWKEGDTSIKLSGVFGDLFKISHLDLVVYNALRLEFMKRDIRKLDGFFTTFPEGVYYNGVFDIEIEQYFDTDVNKISQIKFNLEYITKEDVTIKQDKEDLSEINFYSEIRLNQEESMLNILKGSRKTYGDLQRTGNKGLYFVKFHKNFKDMYKIGQTDVNDYTITNITKQYFNDYIIATYELTKHHNRISQATYIDQTYRWRDNYTNTASERHEYYGDYLFLLPKRDDSLKGDKNKIMNKSQTLQIIFSGLGTKLPKVYEENTKATTALVRTDGFLDYYERLGTYDSYLNNLGDIAITTPVSSFGIKGGFVFTFGFDNNQLVGASLTRRYTNKFEYNMFNRHIRYTDFDGSFKYLDFHIFNSYDMNKQSLEDNDDSFNTQNEQLSLEQYPLIEKENLNNIKSDNLLMFGTGDIMFRRLSDDSLVVNKDPLTNFKLSYGLNVMSYYQGLFIIGQNFFAKNPIVSNEPKVKKYLYLYNDGTTYGMFEDLKVKDGYYNVLPITDGVLNFDSINQVVSIFGLGSETTSWAIGDSELNLDLACNENLDGFQVVDTHIRPNMYEIGSTFKELGSEDDWGIEKPDVPGLPTDPEIPTEPEPSEDGLSLKLGLRLESNMTIPEPIIYKLDGELKVGIVYDDSNKVNVSPELEIELVDNMTLSEGTIYNLDSLMRVGVRTSEGQSEGYSGRFSFNLQDDMELNMGKVYEFEDNKLSTSVELAEDVKLSVSPQVNLSMVSDDFNIDYGKTYTFNDYLFMSVRTKLESQTPIEASIIMSGSVGDLIEPRPINVGGDLETKVRTNILANVKTKPPVLVKTECYDSQNYGTRRLVVTLRNDDSSRVTITMNGFTRRVEPGLTTTITVHNVNPQATSYPITMSSYSEITGQSDVVNTSADMRVCRIEF